MGLPDRELTIKPSSFLSALASVVLEGKDLGYFRLVSESEFKISSPLPSDRAFATSDLHVSGGSVHFSYSYTGFPSNAILDDETVKRKAKIRFQSQAIVSYYVRNIIEVRFSDEGAFFKFTYNKNISHGMESQIANIKCGLGGIIGVNRK